MPPARSVRNAAILGAAGLAGVDAFEAPGTTAAAPRDSTWKTRPRRAPRLRQHTEPRPRLASPPSGDAEHGRGCC
jgi:hypothetical protein